MHENYFLSVHISPNTNNLRYCDFVMSVGGYLFYVKEGEASLEECEEFFIKDINIIMRFVLAPMML